MSACTEADVERMLPLVGLQRREQALKYKHLFGRWACLKSYMLLLYLVELYKKGICDGVADCNATLLTNRKWGLLDFRYNQYGKPYLSAGPYFSISHCKEGILVAVSDKPVGADIESYRIVSDGLISYSMNTDEQEQIRHSEQPTIEFTKLWTRKESVLKLKGTGITESLKEVLQGCEQIMTTAKDRYAFSLALESEEDKSPTIFY